MIYFDLGDGKRTHLFTSFLTNDSEIRNLVEYKTTVAEIQFFIGARFLLSLFAPANAAKE